MKIGLKTFRVFCNMHFRIYILEKMNFEGYRFLKFGIIYLLWENL